MRTLVDSEPREADKLMQKTKTISFTYAICLTIFVCGCQSGSQHASLEQEARQQTQTIRQLEAKVEKTESLLARQDLEIQALRSKKAGGTIMVSSGKTVQLPAAEVLASWAGVTSLSIHQLTSGLSPDDVDPFLHVVLQPLDQDSELVKVAGEIHVKIAMIAASGDPQQIADYSMSITDSRKAWTRGLVSSGIHVKVPLGIDVWQSVKTQKRELLITAILNLGSERQYTATHLFNN